MMLVSLAGVLGAGGLGAGFAFAAAVSFFAVESTGALRAPGFASVGVIRNANVVLRSMLHARVSESLTVIVNVAGGPIFVVSSPARRLFQPSQRAWFCWASPPV